MVENVVQKDGPDTPTFTLPPCTPAVRLVHLMGYHLPIYSALEIGHNPDVSAHLIPQQAAPGRFWRADENQLPMKEPNDTRMRSDKRSWECMGAPKHYTQPDLSNTSFLALSNCDRTPSISLLE